MEYDHRLPSSPPPPVKPKHQTLHSPICFSSCFRSPADVVEGGDRTPSSATSLIRSPSAWLRCKPHDLPELRCRSSKSGGRHHRRRHSSEFGYDPLSYALNFDEGDGAAPAEDLRHRSFSSRLPASPPTAVVVVFEKPRGKEAPV
ncbi:uncharacterized protein [Typha latifolia]|uniref:uncharacterized protein n=1 Tax=Typha latifolia TaxID=4733 RepID=UPI003C2DF57E